MNDDELELLLRSQAGPREHGYEPGQLPNEPDAGGPRSGSRALRWARFAAAAAAGALVVGVGAIVYFGSQGRDVGSGPSPSTGATQSATVHSTASPAESAKPLLFCTDLLLEAERWGGAAGSRGTVVTVRLADGAGPCWISGPVEAQIIPTMAYIGQPADVLVEGSSASDSARELDGAASYAVGISWSNWCGATPTDLLWLRLRFGGDGPGGSGWLAVGDGTNPPTVPPCNGDGGTHLSVTTLQPAD